MTVRRTAEEWLKQPAYAGIEILDPDGWDRQNLDASWAEEIDAAEFDRRLAASTCLFLPGFFDRLRWNGQIKR